MSTMVTRLHRCLVEAIRQTRPDTTDRPVAVAEIYQSLVPYRSAREALGVELNADYEHALLRLLAGEGDLVDLEPRAARDELRRELRSDNPNVGLFRKFAACDVAVKMEPAEASAPSTAAGLEAFTSSAVSTTAPTGSTEADRGAGASPPPLPSPLQASANDADSSGGEPPAEASCPFCRARLPGGRDVKFCYSCGQDQRLRPCRSCGEALERDWRFCIACGTATGASEAG